MNNIIERLKQVFIWIEERDLCVGELWLHPNQIAELEAANDPGWDKVHQQAVIQGYLESKGALNIGLLWGARVFASEKVIENHVAALPHGWEARLVEGTACMPF